MRCGRTGQIPALPQTICGARNACCTSAAQTGSGTNRTSEYSHSSNPCRDPRCTALNDRGDTVTEDKLVRPALGSTVLALELSHQRTSLRIETQHAPCLRTICWPGTDGMGHTARAPPPPPPRRLGMTACALLTMWWWCQSAGRREHADDRRRARRDRVASETTCSGSCRSGCSD